MQANQRLTQAVCRQVETAISQAAGNEVFIIGRLDNQKKVFSVEIAARGNEESVPIIYPYVERGDVVIHNHPSGVLKPSAPDLAIASQLGNRGIGFYIVDNSVKNIYVVAEPIFEKEIKQINAEKLARLIEPEGKLSKIYKDYEQRPSQVTMLNTITRGFNKECITVAEAGTGVGKSLAYLIPAIAWVCTNNERVVISTATINLQQQLLEKDIPLVKKVMDKDPKTVLVKGRGNYVCLMRLKDAMEEVSLFTEQNQEIESIYEWSLTSKTGSKDDLAFYPSDQVWSRVCSEADACFGLRCARREDCFVLKLRREAASARILVVNHHLLFSDLAIRIEESSFNTTAVLPPFKRIIFDEAHNIEKSATSFFSESFNRYSIRKYCNRLYRKKKGHAYGVVPRLQALFKKNEKIKKIPSIVSNIIEQMDITDRYCVELLNDQNNCLLKDRDKEEVKSLVLDQLNELEGGITDLLNLFSDIVREINIEKKGVESLLFEVKLQLQRLFNVTRICKQFKEYNKIEDKIFWLEKLRDYKGERFIRLVITPLDISALMNKAIFQPYPSIIFTSATLTITNQFNYWKSRIGLFDSIQKPVIEGIFPSPFNYKERVLLCIPKDAPQPSKTGYTEFASKTIKQVLAISGGKGLVLFTSYKMLNQVYADVKLHLKQLEINILKQGDADRSKLFKSFKHDTKSVLFATDSFWEGIDSPGRTLEVLILCRLPFQVPTEPIIKARMDYIKQKGGNPFFELSLPQAIMRLKQGFGRLMRRKQDQGVVLILDSRIIYKNYGHFFLQSLPQANKIITERDVILKEIEGFFYNSNVDNN